MTKTISREKMDSIAKELETEIEKQKWTKQRKERAIELVRKVKVLKDSEVIPKLTFIPQECGLEDKSPKERVEQIQNYITELISELNKVSSVIKFKEIGYERIEEFANMGFPCTFAFAWKIV